MSDDAASKSPSPSPKDKSEIATPSQSAVHKANVAGVNPAKAGQSSENTESAESTGTETAQ